MTIDYLGNIYVSYQVQSNGVAIAKYNSSLVFQSKAYFGTSTQGFGSSYTPQGWGLATDSSGNVYWSGEYVSAGSAFVNIMNAGGTTSSGYALPATGIYGNSFLIKYDSSGNYVASTAFGAGAKSCQGQGVTCDSAGNVYWCGTYYNSPTIYDLTQNPNTSSSSYNLGYTGNLAIFLIKYNSSGVYQSSMYFSQTSVNNSPIMPLVYDSYSGHICFCFSGAFQTSAQAIYNMTQNPNASSTGYSFPSGTAGFVMRFNTDGTYIRSCSSASIRYRGASVDSSGNLYVTGFIAPSVAIFNMTPVPNQSNTGLTSNIASNFAPFLMKYDPGGNYVVSATLGNGAINTPTGWTVATDSVNNVYWGGTYTAATAPIYNLAAAQNTSSSGYSITSSTSSAFLIKYTQPPVTSIAMTLPNLGASVTSIVEKPIYVKSGISTTITENSNVFTVPASANVATATWTTDRWIVTYS
jgi:hypothetical protein